MSFAFTVPGRTVMGFGALENCEAEIRGFGKKALIVAGPHVSKTAACGELTALLSQWDVEYRLFSGITGEPTDVMVAAGVAEYQAHNCDFCIGIGGGSSLDSAKAIAAMSVLGGGISDYLGREISGSFPPLVLIPTTAGTGSEATKFTIITDTEKDVKMLLRGDALLPDLAIVDPNYSATSPKSITAATGMDALTHVAEAYTSRKHNALTDPYALDAVKRIFAYLPEAYQNGENLYAREQLAIAAYEAGVCINNSSVTLVHGMSRPIGALFHVPHGISNAMLISECLSFALAGCFGRFADLARVIGAAGTEESDETAAGIFIAALKELCAACEIPTLAQYGIDRDAFDNAIDKMARDAVASGSPGNTMKEITQDDIRSIYTKVY